MKKLNNERFSKKDYKNMLVSEVKKEFGKDVEKYIRWELEVFIFGLKLLEDFETVGIIRSYTKEIIDYILQNDNEKVKNVMLNYIDDLTKKES